MDEIIKIKSGEIEEKVSELRTSQNESTTYRVQREEVSRSYTEQTFLGSQGGEINAKIVDFQQDKGRPLLKYKRGKYRAGKYKEIVELQNKFNELTDLGVEKKAALIREFDKSTDTSLEAYSDIFAKEVQELNVSELKLVNENKIESILQKENYIKLSNMMKNLNDEAQMPTSARMKEVLLAYYQFRENNIDVDEGVAAKWLFDENFKVEDIDKLCEEPRRVHAFLYNCVSTALFDMTNRVGGKTAVDRDAFERLYAMKTMGDVLATKAKTAESLQIMVGQRIENVKNEQDEHRVEDLVENVAEQLVNEGEANEEIDEFLEDEKEEEKEEKKEEKKDDAPEKIFLGEDAIVNIINGVKDKFEKGGDAPDAIKWILKGKYFEYAKEILKTKKYTEDKEVATELEILNLTMSERFKKIVGFAKDRSHGIAEFQAEIAKSLLNKLDKNILTIEGDAFEEEFQKTYDDATELHEKETKINERIEYAKEKILSQFDSVNVDKADEKICADSIFATLLLRTEDAKYIQMVDTFAESTRTNIGFMKEIIDSKVTPFVREELLAKMKEALGMDLVTKSPAAIKLHTEIVMGTLSSKYPAIALKERKIKETIASANLPAIYERAAIDKLYKENKNIETDKMLSVLEGYAKTIEANEAEYLKIVGKGIRLTRAQWEQLEKEKKNHIFDGGKDSGMDESIFAVGINAVIIEMEKKNSEKSNEDLQLEFYDNSVVANIRKNLEQQEKLELSNKVADKLRGKYLCKNEALLDKDQKPILSEDDQAIVMDSLREVLKNKKSALVEVVPSLAKCKNLDDLDSLSIKDQNEVIMLLQGNLLSKVERWAEISGPYATRLRKDLMIDILGGTLANVKDADFEKAVKKYSDEYAKKDEVAKKKIDVILANPEIQEEKVNYVFTDVVIYEKHVFKKDDLLQVPRIERLSYAKKAWELIRENKLEKEAFMLANILTGAAYKDKIDTILAAFDYDKIAKRSEKGDIYKSALAGSKAKFQKDREDKKEQIKNIKIVIKQIEEDIAKEQQNLKTRIAGLNTESKKGIERKTEEMKEAGFSFEVIEKTIEQYKQSIKESITAAEHATASKITQLETEKRTAESDLKGYEFDLSNIANLEKRDKEGISYKTVAELTDEEKDIVSVVQLLNYNIDKDKILELREVFKKVALNETWFNDTKTPKLKDYLHEFLMLDCGAGMVSKGGVLEKEFLEKGEKDYKKSIEAYSKNLNYYCDSIRKVLDKKYGDSENNKEEINRFVQKILPILADLRDVNNDNDNVKTAGETYNLAHYGVRSPQELVDYIEQKTLDELKALMSVKYVNKKIEVEGQQVDVKTLADASGSELDPEKMPFRTYEERKQLLGSYKDGLYKPFLNYLLKKPEVFNAMMTKEGTAFDDYMAELEKRVGNLAYAMKGAYEKNGAIYDQYIMGHFDKIWEQKEGEEVKTVKQLVDEISNFTDALMNYTIGNRKNIFERLNKVDKKATDRIISAKVVPMIFSNTSLWSCLYRERDLRNVIDNYRSRKAKNMETLKKFKAYTELADIDKESAKLYFELQVGSLSDTDFISYLTNHWKDFENLRRNFVVEKPSQAKIIEDNKILRKIQMVKSQGEIAEKDTKKKLDELRVMRYRMGSPIVAHYGINGKTKKFQGKFEKAKNKIAKLLMPQKGEVKTEEAKTEEAKTEETSTEVVNTEAIVVDNTNILKIDEKILKIAIPMVADRMMGEKLDDESILKDLERIRDIYNILKDTTRTTTNDEGVLGEAKINELDLQRVVLNAYGKEKEYTNGGAGADDLKHDAKEFIKNYDKLMKLEYIHLDDKSLASEQASLIESLTMGLYTMKSEEFSDLLVKREKFLFGTEDVVGAIEAYEMLDERIEELTKNDLKVDATPTQVVEFERKKDRIKLGFQDYLRASLVKGITKADLEEDFKKVFSNERAIRFIVDSGSLMGRNAYDDLTINEKPGLTSATRKEAEEKMEKASKKLFKKYIDLSSIEEKRIFFMALAMPGVVAAGETSDNAKLLKNQKLDKDRLKVYQDALLKYAETKEFDPPIDYDKAMAHLFENDELNEDMFKSAMGFVNAVKVATKEQPETNLDKLADGEYSFNVALSLMKGTQSKGKIKNSHEVLMQKMNTTNVLGDFKTVLTNALAEDMKDKKDNGVARTYNAVKNRVRSGEYYTGQGIMERLNRLEGDLDWKMLILILQNRTALDYSTDDGFALGARVSHFVNDELRGELIDTLTDEKALLKVVTNTNEGMYDKAIATLCSYKLKDHTNFKKSLTKSDFTSLERGTLFDWDLLNEALTLLEDVKEERRKVTLVRNASKLIEISGNEKANDEYYWYKKKHRSVEGTEDSEMKASEFDEMLKKHVKNDIQYVEDIPELMAGFMNLDENEKILFIRALEHRDILDVSKQGYWMSFFGQSERNYVSEKTRDSLVTEYIENTLGKKTSMSIGTLGYNKAFLSLLSSQVNDTVDPEKVDDINKLTEKSFGDKRKTAIDWKLFRRALQFVKRTSNERESMLGDMSIYLAHGNVSENGRFKFASQYLRQNLHQSGNRWTRFIGRRGADLALDLVPKLGLASKILLTALGNRTRTKMAGLSSFAPKEAEKTGWAAKNDMIGTYTGMGGDFLVGDTAKEYLGYIMPDGAIDVISNKIGGIVAPAVKDVSGILDGILDNDSAATIATGVIGGVGDAMMSTLSNEKIQEVLLDHGVDKDVLENVQTFGGDVAGRILKHGTFIVEKGMEFYEIHTNRKEFAKVKEETSKIDVKEQNKKLSETGNYKNELQKDRATKEILKNQKLTEVAMNLTKSTMNEDLISNVTGLVSEILEDGDIFNAFGIDVSQDELPIGTVGTFLVKNSARIIQEIGATINAIHRLCTDKTMIKNYYSSSDENSKSPYEEEIDKLIEKYNERRGEYNLEEVKLHEEKSEVAQHAGGFEGFDEHVSYVALNLVRAILFGASRFSAGDNMTFLRSRGIMSALGMKDDIGKTDNDTAQKLFEKISGKEYK